MALNRWVTIVIPAVRPAANSVAVQSVCPADTTMPSAASLAVKSKAPGSSGAKVTIATPLLRVHEATWSAGGNPIRFGLWAPGRTGEMIGPSKCRPSAVADPSAVSSAGRSPRSPPGVAASVLVTTVGQKAATPVLGRCAATVAMLEASLVKSQPQPPLICTSIKPGATILSVTSRVSWTTSTGVSGVTSPVIRPPSNRTSSRSRLPFGNTTEPPVKRVAQIIGRSQPGGSQVDHFTVSAVS